MHRKSSRWLPTGCSRHGRVIAASSFLLALVWTAVAPAEEPVTEPWPTITGEARVGETLTASEASVYKWQRCDPGLHECSDGGQGNHAAGWEDIEEAQGQDGRSYTLVGADLGLMVRVLAKQTSTGTQYVSSASVGPVAPAEVTEPPVDPPPVDPPPVDPPPKNPPPKDPVFNRTANLEPVDGTVWVKPPDSKPQRIEELTQIPVGSKVDVTSGRAELVTQVRRSGRAQAIELWAGAFALKQQRKRAITVLRLRAPFGASLEGAALRGKRGKKLWGRGKCRCRTKGKRSSGTARGTWWLTAERPSGTLTKVLEGTVLVKDHVRKRKVLVKAGQRYLARHR
jgi:hypothetical protein